MSSGTRNMVRDARNFYKRTWTGASTPRGKPFRELPYKLSEQSCSESGFLWTQYPPGAAVGSPSGVVQGSNVYNSCFAPHSTDLISDATLSELLTRNRADLVQQIRGGVNCSVFASELPEALESLVGSSRAVLSAYTAARRGDWASCIRHLSRGVAGVKKAPRRHVRGIQKDLREDLKRASKLDRKDISSTWLSLQYGWLPLLDDVSTLWRKSVLPMVDGSEWTFKQRTSIRVEEPAFLKLNSEGSIFSAAPPILKRCIVRRKWVLAEPPSSAWMWGLTNPFEVFWEKLPMSFVVDWFIPIGDGLTGLSVSQLKLKSWTRSVLRTVETKYDNFSMSDRPSRSNSWNLWTRNSGHYRRTEYQRWVGDNVWTELIAESESPSAPFKELNRAFNKPHILNAAALINQSMRSARRI